MFISIFVIVVVTMTLDPISAATACVMWREEHLWNASVECPFPILLISLIIRTGYPNCSWCFEGGIKTGVQPNLKCAPLDFTPFLQ
jgi:hypothetical protein